MALGTDYGDIYRITHNLVLALRTIERIIGTRDGQMAIEKMSVEKRGQLLVGIRTADIHVVRTLISAELAIEDLDTLSYQVLRERASRLRIVQFNKMHKGELIKHIRAVEDVLRQQLVQFQRPRTGFIEGDGI